METPDHGGASGTYSEVRSPRLYEEVAAQIKSAIMRGDLQAGEQLPKAEELSRQFGVSRVVVREAVQSLRHDGLVDVRHGRGVFVAVPTREVVTAALSAFLEFRGASVSDLHEFREIVEVEIAGMAADRASEGDRIELARNLNRMERAKESPDTYIELDLLFHTLLARATGNPVFLVVLGSIMELLRQSRRSAIVAVPDAVERSLSAHEAINRAVQAGNRQQAQRVMRDHLREAKQRLPVEQALSTVLLEAKSYYSSLDESSVGVSSKLEPAS